MVGVACWSLAHRNGYSVLLSSPAYQAVGVMLLVAGVLSLLGGVLGCVALGREDRCSLVMVIYI